MRGWGNGWPTNRRHDMLSISAGGVTFPGGVNKRLADLVKLIVDSCARDGFKFVPGWCWGYSNRPIAGTNTPSNHSWGLAIDINAPHNPYTNKYRRPDHEHSIPNWVGDRFEKYGFRWGGPAYGDWMHMEFMGTPADADRFTEAARNDLSGRPVVPKPADMVMIGDLLVPILRKGDGYRGERGRVHWYVLTLQACLNVRGLSAQAELDGLFGPGTEALVKELQTRAGITADGVVDQDTWSVVLGNDAPDWAA